ncbi:hypothetical protein [Lentzea sp. E54]|uniref:hypothetical protein n=1 Tax=Lentzea xerophila TaxID=3435883 RepID=UPI003DA2FD0C
MDDLDDELRKLFSDDRLDVHSTPVSTEAVVRGADRRRRRRTAVSGAFVVVALIGLGLGVPQLGLLSADSPVGALLQTASSGATTTPPPPSVSTVTSTVTKTVEQPPATNGGNPGGPNTGSPSKPRSSTASSPATPEAQPGRYGTLALGMSEADALKTGSLVEPGSAADPDNRCKAYATKTVADGNAVIISPAEGIVRITVPSYAKTTKNIGVGSTVTEVKDAYPTAAQNGSSLVVQMAATPRWSYVFENDGTKVTTVLMRLAANDCTTA